MSIPLVNGTAYSYADISLVVAGIPVFGVSSIAYDEEQAKENNFGVGDRPVSRGRGGIEPTASIEIDLDEAEKLRDASPDGSMLALAPFDITVVYLNGVKTTTHILKNCEFKNNGVETSQGDTAIKKSFELALSHVVWRP